MKFIVKYILNFKEGMEDDELIFIPYSEDENLTKTFSEDCSITYFVVDDDNLISFLKLCVNKDYAMTNIKFENYYEDFNYLIDTISNNAKALDTFKKNLEWAINNNLVSHTNNFLVIKNTYDFKHWLYNFNDFKEFIVKHYLENNLSLGYQIEKLESSFIVYYKDTLLINRYESNLKELKKLDQRREVLLKEIAEDKPKIQKMIKMRFGD